MEIKTWKRDGLYLICCLALAIIAERSFFNGEVGIAFIIFITSFFTVYYIRFRGTFKNKRMGALIITCIFLIAGSYGLYDKVVYVQINLPIITALSLLVVVLMMAPDKLKWETPAILRLVIGKLNEGIHYSYRFLTKAFRSLFKHIDPEKGKIMRQIILACIVGVPLLTVLVILLMSADDMFASYITMFPTLVIPANGLEVLIRLLLIFMITFGIFGVFQILPNEDEKMPVARALVRKGFSISPAFGFTILLGMNVVYILFTIVQFKYFFSGHLHADFTYAAYARRGFFELLAVTIINWSLLVFFLKKVNLADSPMRVPMKMMYSVLILASGIMLISAFQRLMLYEMAYGFTIDRMQAHAVMMFLFVVFAYTFVHVWLEGLRLTHFYFIIGLLFYTGMNVVHVEQIIAEKNWERYEATGKIDVDYLTELSSAGMEVLLKVYEADPDYPELDDALDLAIRWHGFGEKQSWQSFNFGKYAMNKKLASLELYDRLGVNRE